MIPALAPETAALIGAIVTCLFVLCGAVVFWPEISAAFRRRKP